MKRPLSILLISLCVLCCGRGPERVRKIVSDGVETVLNGLDPYVIKGEPGRLRLERVLSIDTEDETQLRVGLTDIETFDVDPSGDIYVIQWNTKGDYIYKYDPRGRLLTSFCRNGQGPGEIEWGGTVMVYPAGEIIAKDPSKAKFLVYGQAGGFLRETRLPRILGIDRIFDDGSFVVSWQDNENELAEYVDHVALSDPTFARLTEVGTHASPNRMTAPTITVGQEAFISGASEDAVFVGNSSWGYEIRVFDRAGRLTRKIRKEYRPVPIDEEFRKAYLARISDRSPWKKKYRFSDHWPPFRYLFADDEGRLYVMSREPGAQSGEFLYDIFNAQGAFIGRTSLGNSDPYYPRTAMAKKGLMYSLNEKPNGYKKLDVFRMIWEEQ
jgi:hypothetical protein